MRLNTAAAFKPNSIGKYVVYRHIIAKFDGLIVDYVFGAVDPVAVVQVGSGDDEHADEFVYERAVGEGGWRPGNGSQGRGGQDAPESVSNRQFAPNLSL
ncbi:Uncharacterised protein [Mycobacteroides abscessus subsp. abscessus]|nr:Uncharacterised protein [Mycobacteroides abscessus subsp. abscessus]